MMLTLAAIQEPPGRSSSPSPTGVAVNKGVVDNMSAPLKWRCSFPNPRGVDGIDLPQAGGDAAGILIQINSRIVALA
jgi:hypothetical protein